MESKTSVVAHRLSALLQLATAIDASQDGNLLDNFELWPLQCLDAVKRRLSCIKVANTVHRTHQAATKRLVNGLMTIAK